MTDVLYVLISWRRSCRPGPARRRARPVSAVVPALGSSRPCSRCSPSPCRCFAATSPTSTPRPGHLAVERVAYRVLRVDPDADQHWRSYALSVLGFSLVGVLVLFALRPAAAAPAAVARLRRRCPPTAPGTPRSRFVTNTNWQWYSGEAAPGHLMQMSGLTVQNFVSAAVGMAVAAAFARGLARSRQRRPDRQLLGRPGPRRAPGAAADLASSRRSCSWSPRRRPEPRRAARRCSTLDRRHPGRDRRPGRQPGGDQGARHQRRRLLQRQLRPPVREPDAVHQPARDLPAAADPVRDGAGPSA